VPNYDTSVFILENFTQVRNTVEVVYSQPLQVNGVYWRLKIYPNGTTITNGKKEFLSVFLEMWKGLAKPATYEYKIELVNLKTPSANIVREYASTYEIGECWGYCKFMKLDLLAKEGFLHPENDSLKFIFHVRTPTYYDKCKEQSEYIRSLLLATNNTSNNNIDETNKVPAGADSSNQHQQLQQQEHKVQLQHEAPLIIEQQLHEASNNTSFTVPDLLNHVMHLPPTPSRAQHNEAMLGAFSPELQSLVENFDLNDLNNALEEVGSDDDEGLQ